MFFLTVIGRNDLPGSGTLMYLTGYMSRAAIKGHCVAYLMGVKCAGLPLVEPFFPCVHVKVILLHEGCTNHICLQ